MGGVGVGVGGGLVFFFINIFLLFFAITSLTYEYENSQFAFSYGLLFLRSIYIFIGPYLPGSRRTIYLYVERTQGGG